MPHSTDFDLHKEDALAINDADVKVPYMPVGIYIQEAEDLAKWAEKDKEKLLAAGLPEGIIEGIPSKAGALREAQSIWMKEMRERDEAELEWKERSPEAYEYRDEMLATMRYAFRQRDDLLEKVSMIAEGYGHADMIQDLNDAAVLARENETLIRAIGKDESFWEKGALLSDEMADLRARANGEKFEENQNKRMRDRMYTLLKRDVDEVKACGKYLFRKDKKRLQGYYSRYNRK
ncbi:hypothetical protein ACT29H_03470 [Thermophagus sp. OGC60D27]|uniref:hypothetical protein n=1 Tax=Thermophagus sp. OGC60D27 TaxID=3458415 RepID=UPI004037D0A1